MPERSLERECPGSGPRTNLLHWRDREGNATRTKWQRGGEAKRWVRLVCARLLRVESRGERVREQEAGRGGKKERRRREKKSVYLSIERALHSAASRTASPAASAAVLAPACPGTSAPRRPAARRPTPDVLARAEPDEDDDDDEPPRGQPRRTPIKLRAKSSPKPARTRAWGGESLVSVARSLSREGRVDKEKTHRA